MELVKSKKAIPLLILLLLAGFFVGIIFKPTTLFKDFVSGAESLQIKNELLAEFNEAYLEDEPKSTIVKEFSISAGISEIEIVDGYSTEVWSYNNQVPGPEFRVKLGETVKVLFTNNLPQETTIHWHGIRVSNAMDGVPGVTQDPIQPGKSFIYEFTPKDAGTFWFHPHVRGSEQVERGLYGTLVVEDPEQPTYETDSVFVLDDWRLLDGAQIDPRFNTNHDLMHDGRWGNVITVNGKLEEQLTFKPGSTNRLRLVNTSNARVYRLDFGSLQTQAIAVDGMTVGETFDPQGYELAPGNRLDVLVSIPIDAVNKSFSIRDTFTRQTYQLVSLQTNDQVVQSNYAEFTTAYVPDWNQAHDLSMDNEYVLDARRATGGMGMGMMGIEWTINGKAFPDFDPITLQHNTFNKIRLTNKSSRLHPMHLHGQFFKVLARNGEPVDEPYWRDTVLLHSKETVDIGLVPLDKGSWANHCHILEHAEAGMMTVVEVQ